MDTWRKRLKSLIGGENQPSMKRLSLDAGLGETYVRDMLARRRDPTIGNLQRIADRLGTTVGALLGESEEPPPGVNVPVISAISLGPRRAIKPARIRETLKASRFSIATSIIRDRTWPRISSIV